LIQLVSLYNENEWIISYFVIILLNYASKSMTMRPQTQLVNPHQKSQVTSQCIVLQLQFHEFSLKRTGLTSDVTKGLLDIDKMPILTSSLFRQSATGS
jgi:hypothetical protein